MRRRPGQTPDKDIAKRRHCLTNAALQTSHSAASFSSGKKSPGAGIRISAATANFVLGVAMMMSTAFWILQRLLIAKLYVFLCFWHFLNFLFLGFLLF
jgi:hypothetical protein